MWFAELAPSRCVVAKYPKAHKHTSHASLQPSIILLLLLNIMHMHQPTSEHVHAVLRQK